MLSNTSRLSNQALKKSVADLSELSRILCELSFTQLFRAFSWLKYLTVKDMKFSCSRVLSSINSFRKLLQLLWILLLQPATWNMSVGITNSKACYFGARFCLLFYFRFCFLTVFTVFWKKIRHFSPITIL